MPFRQLKRIVWSIALIAVMGTSAYVAYTHITGYVDAKERSFEEKILMVQQQIASLYEAVQTLAGANSEVALSVKELQNRKQALSKSQDELLTDAVAKVAPAVVSIVVSKDVPNLEVTYENPFGNDPFFKDFNVRVPVYRQKGTVTQKVGAGTGFIISPLGYVLTNRHVVSDPSATYTALLSDGAQKNGRVIFRDTKNDIALLKIEGSGFTSVPLGDSSNVKLGQTVVAIGNALGEYSNSVSVGIISGLNRDITASNSGGGTETLKGVIQTDAAINQGNSGGPLINTSGEVIGVNVATVVGSSNISFSIPIAVAKALVQPYLK